MSHQFSAEVAHEWDETEEFLQVLWPNQPRRISFSTALAWAGVPMVTGITAAAATPPSLKSSAITEKYLGFIPVLESPELLLADAQQLTEFTWLSNPGRALLETAQRPERIGRRWAERTGLAVDILDDCLNTELLDEITERHDWRDGYRRIASLCEGLASTSVAEEPAGQALFLRWAQRLPHCEPHEDWIDMFGRCALRKPFPEAVHDQQRRVRWDLPAPGIAETILT